MQEVQRGEHHRLRRNRPILQANAQCQVSHAGGGPAYGAIIQRGTMDMRQNRVSVIMSITATRTLKVPMAVMGKMAEQMNETYVKEEDQSEDEEEGGEDNSGGTRTCATIALSGTFFPLSTAEGQGGDDHSARAA